MASGSIALAMCTKSFAWAAAKPPSIVVASSIVPKPAETGFGGRCRLSGTGPMCSGWPLLPSSSRPPSRGAPIPAVKLVPALTPRIAVNSLPEDTLASTAGLPAKRCQTA